MGFYSRGRAVEMFRVRIDIIVRKLEKLIERIEDGKIVVCWSGFRNGEPGWPVSLRSLKRLLMKTG